MEVYGLVYHGWDPLRGGAVQYLNKNTSEWDGRGLKDQNFLIGGIKYIEYCGIC